MSFNGIICMEMEFYRRHMWNAPRYELPQPTLAMRTFRMQPMSRAQ